MVELLTPGLFLFVLWILLFNWWFNAESEDMTMLLGILFLPYSIFFALTGLPLLGLAMWEIYFIVIALGLIVTVYTLDLKFDLRHRK